MSGRGIGRQRPVFDPGPQPQDGFGGVPDVADARQVIVHPGHLGASPNTMLAWSRLWAAEKICAFGRATGPAIDASNIAISDVLPPFLPREMMTRRTGGSLS